MKLKNWGFCLSLFICLAGSAQQDAILVPYKNRAYNEVENHFRVIYKRKELWPREYRVSSADTSLHFYKTDTSLVLKNNVYYGSPSLTLTSKKGDTIFSGAVYMEHIPDPVFTLDGKLSGGNIEKRTLKYMHGIVPLLEVPTAYEGFPLQLRIYVDSFQVNVHVGNEERELVCNGPAFSKELLDIISKLRLPDILEFTTFYCHFNDRRRVLHSDMAFTLISGYNSFSDDYLDLLSELKYERVKGSLNYDSLYKVYDIPNDRDTEKGVQQSAMCRLTDCNSNTDTCYMKYYIGTCVNKELVSEYRFTGDYTYYKVYLSGKPIIEYGWNSNSITGPFTLYYTNGKKRIEGFTASYRDTSKEINIATTYIEPVTLEEQAYVEYNEWYGCPDGIWKYYDRNGKVYMTKAFDHGTLIKETKL